MNVLGRYLEVGSAGRLRLLLSLIMLLTFAYRRRSSIITKMTNLVIALSPNLRRDRVSYNGTLTQPLRFREAISALHDVVISDLRFKQKDKSAYEAYKAEQKQREDALRRAVSREVRAQALAQQVEPMPEGLEVRPVKPEHYRARTTPTTCLSMIRNCGGC